MPTSRASGDYTSGDFERADLACKRRCSVITQAVALLVVEDDEFEQQGVRFERGRYEFCCVQQAAAALPVYLAAAYCAWVY